MRNLWNGIVLRHAFWASARITASQPSRFGNLPVKATFSRRLRIDAFNIDIEDLSMLHWSLQGHLNEAEQPLSQLNVYMGDREICFDSLAEVADADVPDVLDRFDYAFAAHDKRAIMVCDGKGAWFTHAKVMCDAGNEAWGRAAVNILHTTLRRHRVWNWWLARPVVLLVAAAFTFTGALALPVPLAALPALAGLGIASIFFFDLGPSSVIRVRRTKGQDAKPRRRASRRLSAEP